MQMNKITMVTRGWLAASAAATVLLALAVWLAVSGPAQAAANTVVVTPASATVAPGGQVTVKVVGEAPAGKKIGGWDLKISFNAAVLQAVDCAGQSNCNKDFAAGQVAFNGFSGGGLSGSQVLAEVTFKAIGASGTSSALTVAGDFNDETATATNPTFTGGTINVLTPTPSPSPSPTAVPSASPTASPSPSPTAGALPKTGGSPSDGTSLTPWLLAVLGLAVVSGGAWAGVADAPRDPVGTR